MKIRRPKLSLGYVVQEDLELKFKQQCLPGRFCIWVGTEACADALVLLCLNI